MNWDYIDVIKSLEGVNTLHCDTRDFHCIRHADWINTKDGLNREISRRFYASAYNIKEGELLSWLKGIEQISGGKGKWRSLYFKSVVCDDWLKYIRCYRNPKKTEYFIVCNSHNIPIFWELCDEGHLVKDCLNFIKE